MSQLEREKFEKAAKSYKQRVTASPEAARRFLIELGVFTEKGNLREPYKSLCIPQGQD